MQKTFSFLVGPVQDDLYKASNPDDFFTSKSGEDFLYRISYDGETVMLEDTCERSLPLDVEDLDQFIFILNKIRQYAKNTVSLQAFLESTFLDNTVQ